MRQDGDVLYCCLFCSLTMHATHGRVAWAHSHGQRGVPAGVSWHICLDAWLGVGLACRLGWLGHGAQAALLWGFSLWL